MKREQMKKKQNSRLFLKILDLNLLLNDYFSEMYECIYVCKYVLVCMYICTSMYVCMYACMCVSSTSHNPVDLHCLLQG
jgi:hypothetical protein